MRAGLVRCVSEPRRDEPIVAEIPPFFAGVTIFSFVVAGVIPIALGVKLGLNPEGAGGLILPPGFSLSCLLR